MCSFLAPDGHLCHQTSLAAIKQYKKRSHKEIWSKIVGFRDSPFWKLPKLNNYQWRLANHKHLTIEQFNPLYKDTNKKSFFHFSNINHILEQSASVWQFHAPHTSLFPMPMNSTQASHWTLALWGTILLITPKVTTSVFHISKLLAMN